MARMLKDNDIETILAMIDGWTGKLTYEKLIDAVALQLKHRFTRQTLFAHVRIREAMCRRKKGIKEGPVVKEVRSVELQKALDRIGLLDAEAARLRAENESLLTQFVRWAYNAHTKGLTPELLNKALPQIDRRRSKIPPAKDPLAGRTPNGEGNRARPEARVIFATPPDDGEQPPKP